MSYVSAPYTADKHKSMEIFIIDYRFSTELVLCHFDQIVSHTYDLDINIQIVNTIKIDNMSIDRARMEFKYKSW
jgi:hypothetical protein